MTPIPTSTSTASPASARQGNERWVLPVVVVLAALSLIPVWQSAPLPLEDVPNHLLKVDLVRRYLAGDQAVRAMYDLNLTPFSNLACYVVIIALAPIVGLVGAAKCFVSAYLLALPLCAYLWLQRANSRNVLLALAVPALAHNLFLTKGNLNFCAALPLYVAALAIVTDAPTTRSTLWFTLIATLLYFTHGVVFLSLVLVVGIVVLTDLTLKRSMLLVGLAPGLVCFALTTGVQAIHDSQSVTLPLGFAVQGAVGTALEWLFGPRELFYHTTVAHVWAGVLIGCGVYTALTPGRSHETTEGVRRSRWLLAGAAFVAAFLVLPGTLADWAHLRERFVPLAVITLLAAVRLPQPRIVRMSIATLLVGCSLARTVEATHGYAIRSQLVREYVSGISVVEPNASILPIYDSLDDDVIRTNLHSWAYYVVERGGWSPNLQHQQSMRTARLLYPIVFRTVPWAPDESQPALSFALAQRAAACYDYVIMWAPSPADERLLASYFDQVHSTPHMQIWRNRAGLKQMPPVATPACLVGSTSDIV